MRFLIFKYVYKLIGRGLDLYADMKPEFDEHKRAQEARRAAVNAVDAEVLDEDGNPVRHAR